MNYQEKTKEELIAALLQLEQESGGLSGSLSEDMPDHIDEVKDETGQKNEFCGSNEQLGSIWNTGQNTGMLNGLNDGNILKLKEAFFQLPGIGIVVLSSQKRWIDINEGFKAMVGYSNEELSDLSWSELSHPDDLATDEAQFLKIMSGHQDSYYLEKRFVHKNGDTVWTNLSVSCVRKSDRSIDYMVALLQNITERKLAEDELRIKEERYRLITENARDVIWTMKLDGTITYISPNVEQLRGFTVEEAIHQQLDQIITPDTQVLVIDYILRLNSAYASGKPLPHFKGENEYYCKDGSTLWTEVIVYPLAGSDQKSVTMLGMTRDISERKQYEAKLLEQTNNLRELNATKDKFFSIIAHDLRSPFNGILGLSEILKDEARDLDIDSIVDYTEMIHTSANQAYNLLENLLDWAKMQQGHFRYEPKKELINNLINNEINGLKYNAGKKNIALVNITKEDIIVTLDEKMLSAVLRNLVTNAIKFTAKNGFVNVDAKINSGHVEVSVSDNGVGMDQKTIEKLFKIETSFTSCGTENEKGTGLGLLLCKDFVEKHGGKMWVESELGKGSRFIFSIPIQ